MLKAMSLITDAPKVTQRGGKKYTQVQDRIEAFRKVFAFEYGIETKLLKDDGTAIMVQAIITNGDGRTIGSGLAEEVRGSSNVNTTSPIENGETSAIGRALASLGLHGGEYASANEMDKVERMEKPPAVDPPPVTENLGQPNITFKQSPPPDAAQLKTDKLWYELGGEGLGNKIPMTQVLDIPPFLQRDDGQPTWAGDQIKGIKEHRHLGELKLWRTTNQEQLKMMKDVDPAGRAAVVEAYNLKIDEFKK